MLAAPTWAQGPGLGNLQYSPEEVGKPVSVISTKMGHSRVAMHRGYLIVIPSQDGGGGNGSIAIYDVSDPRAPKKIHENDYAEAVDIREAHGWGFRGDIACLQASYGIQFWDFSSITRPRRISYLRLPDVAISDYDRGMWWTHWQGRYVYGGGSGNGLYIVDALDPANPVFVKKIPISQLGGFRVGSTHVVGNLLILTGFDPGPSGMAILDISDPVNPQLMSTTNQVSSYSSMVNGNRLVLASREAHVGTGVVYDLSDPYSPKILGASTPALSSNGGYVNFADGHVFVGFEKDGFGKIDMSKPDFPLVQVGKGGSPTADDGFPTPLGNLVFSGNDHGNLAYGSALIPHQAEPDTLGPRVNMVVPADDARGQATTSRVGLTFTDQVDALSLTRENVTIRSLFGDTVDGYYTAQAGIVNFHPKSPLRHNLPYEVIVRKGGVKDYAGNPSPEAFRSLFVTGDRTDCVVRATSDSELRDTVTFSLTCDAPIKGRVAWSFGDGSRTEFEAGRTSIRHVFEKPGAYLVSARIEEELVSGAVRLYSVLGPVEKVRSTRASTLLLDSARGRVWNVNADNNSVTVSDARLLQRIAEIPVGAHPRTLAMDPGGRVWVTNQDDASLSVIDAETFEVRHTVKLPPGSAPYGIAFSPASGVGYVTLEALGQLAKIDPASRQVEDTLTVFPSARGLAISGSGASILVSRFISEGQEGEVAEIDARSFTLSRNYALAYDASLDGQNSGAGVPNAVAAVTIAPDGKSAWVPFKKDNVRRGLAPGQLNRNAPTFENTVRTAVAQLDLETGLEKPGARLDLDNRSLANAVTFDGRGAFAYVTTQASNHTVIIDAVSGRNATAIEPQGLDSELAPDGLVLDAKDSLLYVHYFTSRQVGVYDVSRVGKENSITRKALIPTVVAEKLDPKVLRGKQIFYNASDRRMSRDRYMSCVVCHMEGGSDGRVWDFTHKGEGLRRTPTLLGRGGMAHGPAHWSANFDEIQDFEQDIRGEFGGAGFLDAAQFAAGTRSEPLGDKKAGLSQELDALAAYLGTLTSARRSPHRAPDGGLTADARAGQLIFHRPEVGCATCHAPPRYTNSGTDQGGLSYPGGLPKMASVYSTSSSVTGEGFLLQDVGTLKSTSGQRLGKWLPGLDTPTLLGVWAGGPYLHDGSAATLMDVITTANPQDRHGRTSQLNAKEKSQLVAFLMQLDRAEPVPQTPTHLSPMAPGAFSLRKTGAGYLIEWNIVTRERLTFAVHDVKGLRVAFMELPASDEARRKTLWNGLGARGEKLAAGIYEARLTWKGGSLSRRVTLAR